MFEYWLNPDELAFDQWTKSPYFYSIDYNSTTPMGNVTVPTPDTCSITFWMALLLKVSNYFFLFVVAEKSV